MPGKYTDGYTKSAQKAKFVRHRDVKMKDSELKKEAKIQKLMCEGVCQRCREKVQWRFKFDKYKPLKSPATCQECKHKRVTKAYRTLCDGCAQSRGVCPGCCTDLSTAGAVTEPSCDVVPSPSHEPAGEATASTIHTSDTADVVVDTCTAADTESDHASATEEMNVESQEDLEEVEGLNPPRWNEQKFLNMAASKYSKTRRIGTDF